MEVLLTAAWVLVALGTCWAIVGLVQFFFAIRHDLDLSELDDTPPEPPANPLARPRLPDRELYERRRILAARRTEELEARVHAHARISDDDL